MRGGQVPRGLLHLSNALFALALGDQGPASLESSPR
jgi:hypothetical protein